jgi:hypothetical protein
MVTLVSLIRRARASVGGNGRQACSNNYFSSGRDSSLASFYADEGLARRYYYLLDSRGQLFLQSSKHRNFATSIRDAKVLSLFFRMMRPIKKQEVSLLASIDTCNPSSSYRWVSVCGKETNFVATEDEIASVGFTDLDGTSGDLLYAAGQLSEPFDPDMVHIASSTGRLYHPVNNHRFLKGTWGLLHPSLAQKLMMTASVQADTYSFEFQGKVKVLRELQLVES